MLRRIICLSGFSSHVAVVPAGMGGRMGVGGSDFRNIDVTRSDNVSCDRLCLFSGGLFCDGSTDSFEGTGGLPSGSACDGTGIAGRDGAGSRTCLTSEGTNSDSFSRQLVRVARIRARGTRTGRERFSVVGANDEQHGAAPASFQNRIDALLRAGTRFRVSERRADPGKSDRAGRSPW